MGAIGLRAAAALGLAAAALAEFARRGFAAARMADIAAHAGLSKAALYVYYPTKGDLFRAVLAQYAMPRLAGLRSAAEAGQPFAASLDLLLDRLAADSRLGLSSEQLAGLLAEPLSFTGAARDQVAAVVSAVDAALTSDPDAADLRPEPIL